ncbi:MAG: hypothetical protein FWG08_06360 [Propionibacteriaceae bacterium]|nr:hypothetical protein [Propionibacteriaceae bacterium]
MKLRLSFVALLAGAALALSGCGDTPVPEETDVPDPGTPTEQVEAFDRYINIIGLGMTEEQVTSHMADLQWPYDIAYEDGGSSAFIEADEISIWITEDRVGVIGTYSTAMQTNRGVRVGDPESKVIDQYGDNYTEVNATGGPGRQVEYFDGQTYLRISFDESNTVAWWEIAQESTAGYDN